MLGLISSVSAAQGEKASFESLLESGTPFEQSLACEKYITGEGVAVDYAKARALCMKAAEGCYGDAGITLAHIYHKGLGVPADPLAALGWNYLTISDAAYEITISQRRQLEKLLSPAEIEKARAFAKKWEAEHCDKGSGKQ